MADPKNVMVIHGQDGDAKEALFDWLRRVNLRPLEWGQLVQATGSGMPFIGQVLNQAFQDAQAVVALFTPDEQVRSQGSRSWRRQARPNVFLEAGMALATHPDQTVMVVLGSQYLPSDLDGRHYVRLNGTSKPLHDLAFRLRKAGCEIDITGTDWLDAAIFPDRDNPPSIG